VVVGGLCPKVAGTVKPRVLATFFPCSTSFSILNKHGRFGGVSITM
jgi:hypothetical protein